MISAKSGDEGAIYFFIKLESKRAVHAPMQKKRFYRQDSHGLHRVDKSSPVIDGFFLI
jgi:DICT domain-containing protein